MFLLSLVENRHSTAGQDVSNRLIQLANEAIGLVPVSQPVVKPNNRSSPIDKKNLRGGVSQVADSVAVRPGNPVLVDKRLGVVVAAGRDT